MFIKIIKNNLFCKNIRFLFLNPKLLDSPKSEFKQQPRSDPNKLVDSSRFRRPVVIVVATLLNVADPIVSGTTDALPVVVGAGIVRIGTDQIPTVSMTLVVPLAWRQVAAAAVEIVAQTDPLTAVVLLECKFNYVKKVLFIKLIWLLINFSN